MDKFYIHATEYTPMIHFDPLKGLIELKGNSTPHNTYEFYDLIISKLQHYVTDGSQGLIANMAFKRINTSSSMLIYDVIRKINLIKENGRMVKVNWYYKYNDQEMHELGKDFSAMLDLQFNFVSMAA